LVWQANPQTLPSERLWLIIIEAPASPCFPEKIHELWHFHMITFRRCLGWSVWSLILVSPVAAEELFKAKPLTASGQFTEGIEGPACDANGNVYAVNFAVQQTIGVVTPDGRGQQFVKLPGNSVGNGIRFDSRGRMLVADYVGHNVLRIDMKTRKIEIFAHQAEMNQPNDLAIGPDDTLYASDPNWAKGTGQLWRISPDGRVKRLAKDMGTTNGIEVSPDGKRLYVNESVQRNIWVFDLSADGIANKRLLTRFSDHGFDGMRCDTQGNLYVTRYGKGTVVKLSPDGKILQEIDVLGAKPSNICFGGPDGRTAYVTEVEHRRLVQFRVDHPGVSWARLQRVPQ
jgi:sugar lactone lactonase YvrE